MGSKKDRDQELESLKNIWVYEGERRPVVVEAKNERHAKDKIRKSPHYDGFPILPIPLLKFLEKCAPREDVPVPVEVPKKKDDSHVFISIKALGGLVKSVKIYSSEKTATADAEKISSHLDSRHDDLKVFSLENHKEIGEEEFMEAKICYEGIKREEVVKEEVKVEEAKPKVKLYPKGPEVVF